MVSENLTLSVIAQVRLFWCANYENSAPRYLETHKKHYPFTELKTVRNKDWIKTTLLACTRFAYSDLHFDPEEIRLGICEAGTDISRLT